MTEAKPQRHPQERDLDACSTERIECSGSAATSVDLGALEEKKDAPDVVIEIPDGGYGWLIVVATFLLNFNTWGANSGFAIYLSYYLNHDQFAGADKYDYAFIGGITFGVGLIFSPCINFSQSVIGFRPTIILGMFCQFAGLILASFATKLWQLYLTQGVLQAFGLAFMSIPAFAILPQWFKKKRAFASAISAAGAGVGGLVYNLGMQRVLQARSVHWALRAQAIMCFGLSWISVALLRRRLPIKRTFVDLSLMKNTGFWLCAFYILTCMFGYVVVLYDMANFTTAKGYTAYQGSIASAMVQVGSVFGRPLVGRLADHFGHITVTCGAYFLACVFVWAMWIPAQNLATIYAFCIIAGGLMGSIFATIPAVLTKVFGLRNVNVALCMLWVFLGIGGIFTPAIGISLVSTEPGVSDPYLHCSIFSGAGFFCAALTLLIMRGYVMYRHTVAEHDADEGHTHIEVPFYAPFTHAFTSTHKI